MKAELSSRERVRLALNHQEPDRVPIVFGADGTTTMVAAGYDALKRKLGIESETRLYNRAFQYSILDEAVMRRFHSDLRPVVGQVSSRLAVKEGPVDTLTDFWGIGYRRPAGAYYYDMVSHPLQAARTIADIAAYPWPDAKSLLDLRGLREQAHQLRHETPYAILGWHHAPSSVFELSWYLRGLPEFLTDLAAQPEMAQAVMRRMTDLAKDTAALYLKEVGDYIDIFGMGDDLGVQGGPMISLKMYRELVKPYQAEYYAALHELTPAKLMMHSCGGIHPFLDDLIEIGVEIINPVQVSARDMDPKQLKAQYGDRLCFCGGIDTQYILPYGTQEEVEEEVHRRIRELAPGGGYLLAAVHAIQPDVPVDNVCTLFDAALRFGSYPIQ